MQKLSGVDAGFIPGLRGNETNTSTRSSSKASAATYYAAPDFPPARDPYRCKPWKAHPVGVPSPHNLAKHVTTPKPFLETQHKHLATD